MELPRAGLYSVRYSLERVELMGDRVSFYLEDNLMIFKCLLERNNGPFSSLETPEFLFSGRASLEMQHNTEGNRRGS